MKRSNLIIKNGVYLFFRLFLVMAITFYSTRLTLKILGDENYGINNIIGGVIAMFAIVSMPVVNALQRYFNVEFSRKTIDNNKVFCTAVWVVLLMIVFMLLLYETVGIYFVEYVLKYPEERRFVVRIIFQVTALTTVVSILMLPYTALLYAKEKMGIPATIGIFEAVGKLGLLFVIPYVCLDALITYSLILLVLFIAELIFYIVYCNHHYPETRLKLWIDRDLLKNISAFSGWNFIESVGGVAITYVSNIFINVFGGIFYNTAYGISKQLTSAVLQFTTNVLKAADPQITIHTVTHEDNYRNKLVLSTIKLSFIGVSTICIIFHVYGEELLQWWLGNVPQYVFSFCSIALMGTVFSSIVLPLRSLILATGFIQKYFTLYGAIMFLGVFAIWIELKLGMPIISVMYTMLAINVVVFLVSVFYVSSISSLKVISVFYAIALSLIPLTISCIVIVGIRLTTDNVMLSILPSIISLIIILASVTYVVVLNRSEKIKIKEMIKMIKKYYG